MLLPLLINVFGPPRTGSGGFGQDYAFNCPQCAEVENGGIVDGKHNLEIKFTLSSGGGYGHCWKCGTSGRVDELLFRFGGVPAARAWREGVKRYGFQTSKAAQFSSPPPPRLPADFTLISHVDETNEGHLAALEYLCGNHKDIPGKLDGRAIDRKIAERFGVGFSLTGRYENRIIIPSYAANGILDFFVARTWDPAEKQAYQTPKVDKNFKQRLIFNEAKINWGAPILLVEGAFDMLACPVNTIPLLGKALPDRLFEQLVFHNATVIIGLDQDAQEDTPGISKKGRAASVTAIGNKLLEAGLENVFRVNLPEKDWAKNQQDSGIAANFQVLRENIERINFDSF